MVKFFHRNIEILVWSLALLYLALINPDVPRLFSFCLFHNIGLEFCPGCGLGRSISYFLHGNIAQSFLTHPLGIPAVFILAHRIALLSLHQYYRKTNRLTY